MLKKNMLLCCLVLFIVAFGNTTFAAPPYASILAYNQNNGSDAVTNMQTLGTLDIINMTPWDISVGPSAQTTILKGMTAAPLQSFWLKGINTPVVAGNASMNNAFAYHSLQIPLASMNAPWALDTPLYNYLGSTSYSTIPIVFNTMKFWSGSSTATNTVALDFMVTSSAGFASQTMNQFPATTLSYGDGTNNYAWESGDTSPNNSAMSKGVTNFLTIQQKQIQGTQNWVPITNNVAGVNKQNGVGGKAAGTLIQCPPFLSVSGLAYPNFSSVSGVSAIAGQNYDLVVIIQSGGYADMQLLILAVPSTNDAYLNPNVYNPLDH